MKPPTALALFIMHFLVTFKSGMFTHGKDREYARGFKFVFSSSLALRIHISEVTKRILEAIGGFTVESRGEVFLKVSNGLLLGNEAICDLFTEGAAQGE